MFFVEREGDEAVVFIHISFVNTAHRPLACAFVPTAATAAAGKHYLFILPGVPGCEFYYVFPGGGIREFGSTRF